MNRSASAISAPISVPPSISRVVRGVVPADKPEPDPVTVVAVSYTHLTLPTKA